MLLILLYKMGFWLEYSNMFWNGRLYYNIKPALYVDMGQGNCIEQNCHKQNKLCKLFKHQIQCWINFVHYSSKTAFRLRFCCNENNKLLSNAASSSAITNVVYRR